MKKVAFLSIIIALVFTACNSNQAKTEETKSSTETFNELSKEEGFAEKHNEPKKLEDKTKGEMIAIPVEGGKPANVYQLKNEKETNNYLFVIHEWWGLNDYIKREADRWYDTLGNVHVMALDLYDGKVAETKEKAQEYMNGVDEKRIKSIIEAAIAQLPDDANVGTIGWCFGGGWSLRTAIQAGDKTEACVMYYGMPVKEVEKLEQLNSDVLFIYGTQDEWINEAVAENFKENMKKANKSVKILAFDADHAFANPSGDRYKEAAAQEANHKAYEYLKKRLN